MRRVTVLLLLLTGCATTTEMVPPAWLSVPQATRIRAVQLDEAGNVTVALQPLRDQGVRVENNRLMRGDKALTEPFAAIESFDVSESRGEVAFAAKRKDDFDIGLVSTDGSPISWVPSEPVDEVGVQWAPRGNKISYIVRLKTGDIVRTVHIPTAAQLTVDFVSAKIETLGWDPKGERFAVAYSTADASDRVEVMTYSGARRTMALPPAQQLEYDVAAFAPETVSLRPRDIAYGEKLPVVVWVDDEPFAWNDARAELLRTTRVACIVTRRLGPELWSIVDRTEWIDAARTVVVGPRDATVRNALLITADPAIPAGRFRRTGNVVAVAPAVMQSFASRFIADQWKRTGTANGSSR